MVRNAKSTRMHSFLRNLCFQYPRPLYPLKNIFRGCSSKAVDLIAKLITWDPEQRLSVEEALQHPYMASLSCPEDEPVSQSIASAFNFEKSQMTVQQYKKLMQQELDQYAEANNDEAFALLPPSPRMMVQVDPQLSSSGEWEQEEEKKEQDTLLSRMQRIKLAAKSAFVGSSKKTSPKNQAKSPVGSKTFSFGNNAITSVHSHHKLSDRSEM